MKMKTGVEQSVYAILILNMLPDKAVVPGEAISKKLGASSTYFQKLLRKLVNADLIISVPGVKGGFRLSKKPEDISVYDIYLAIEGQQSLYSSRGVLDDMFELEYGDRCCLLTKLMEEAESAWEFVLKRETISSIYKRIKSDYELKIQSLEEWVKENMVL